MNRARTMVWAVIAVSLVLLPLACGGGGGEEMPADSLTQRQKDSIASTLPVPGAGAIQKALDASDAARERAQQHDTLLRR
ncbi:hypothetical protein ACFL3S_02455 [Gemmatimonadota bacterium]